MKYLITGGGTGGHIYPALAIATEIKNKHKDAKILYVGTENGLESDLVPKEGFDFKTIRVKGMPRSINKESFIAAKELLLGLNDSRKIIKDFNPDIVIGTGGYVCGPVVYMASKKKIPTLIHEQNAFPGITNKILSRYVDKVAVTFEEAKKYFKHSDRVVLTGNPIRKSITQVDKSIAYRKLGINPNIPFILSFGGSGGQKKLNDAMFYFIKENIGNNNLQIIHITGKRLYDDFMGMLEEEEVKLPQNIKIFPYFYDIPEGLNLADLVIASAGAITLAEISAVGVPSIIIPKGYTAENHQEYNAKVFEDQGASLVILEKDLIYKDFNKIIDKTIYNKDKLLKMSEKSKELGRINAAENIVEAIDSLTI